MLRFFKMSLAMLLGVTLSGIVAAQGYFGVAAGEGEADIGGFDLGNDTAIKVFAGNKFSTNFGYELAYIDFGELTKNVGVFVTKFKATGYDISAVGYLPVGESVEVIGKVGLLVWDAELTAIQPGFAEQSQSDNSTDLNLGVGINFNVGDNIAIRTLYERFELDNVDVDYLSAAVIFKF